ncbi:hypothetical protein AOLI_G00004140 [Acnodon oligacanthus]
MDLWPKTEASARASPSPGPAASTKWRSLTMLDAQRVRGDHSPPAAQRQRTLHQGLIQNSQPIRTEFCPEGLIKLYRKAINAWGSATLHAALQFHLCIQLLRDLWKTCLEA